MAREFAAQQRTQMSRAVRTARGIAGASAATLLAAASHALAGGQVTLLALLATTMLALPVCVALAGRVGSLWRVALGVSVSQFLYHWTFAGLGLTSVTGASTPPAAHAHHTSLDLGTSLLPAIGAADASMWIAHAGAAALTIVLVWRGERAALGLVSLLLRLMPTALPILASLPARARLSVFLPRADSLHGDLRFLSALSHRGPPRGPAPALWP